MGMDLARMAIVNVMPAYHKVLSNLFDQDLLLWLLRTDDIFSDAVRDYVWDSLEAEQAAWRAEWRRTHDANDPPPQWRALACGGEVAAFVVDSLMGTTWEIIAGIPFRVLVIEPLGLVCCLLQHPSAHLMAGTAAGRRRRR